jgi:putative transcriptional regulator
MDDVAADFAEPRGLAPAAGRLLLAMPMLLDPNFAGSVVYLLESSLEEGSAGLVINRPTRTPVGQVLPGWHDAASAPAVIFRGGPVQPDGALCLAGPRDPDPLSPVPGLRPIRRRRGGSTGVALVDLDADVAEIAAAVSEVRVFAGHAGWSPGQLEAEIAEGAWWVVPGAARHVFGADPTRLWSTVCAEQPNRVALLATYPSDPTLN